MTILLPNLAKGHDAPAAKKLGEVLLETNPKLDDPEVALTIIEGIQTKRQIDIVILFEDRRPKEELMTTKAGAKIHSFVLVLEVKNHKGENVISQGPSLLVSYQKQNEREWKNATEQCSNQVFALKEFLEDHGQESEKRKSCFVNGAIWLTEVPEDELKGRPTSSKFPVHFKDLTWEVLTNALETSSKFWGGGVRCFTDNAEYHNFETISELLTGTISPKSFDNPDADKAAEPLPETAIETRAEVFADQAEQVDDAPIRSTPDPTMRPADKQSPRPSLKLNQILLTLLLGLAIIKLLGVDFSVFLDGEVKNKEVVTVVARSLNVRSCPSTDCEVISSNTRGTKLISYERRNGWIRVSDNEPEMWVAEQFTEDLQN